MIHQRSRGFWTAAQLVLAVAVIGAGWYGGDLALGVGCALGLAASIAAFQYLSRRGHSVAGVLTGVGDERERTIYREASYRTAEMSVYALTIWAIATVAQGESDPTLFYVLGGYGALWALNLAWVSLQARRPAKSASA